jgi:hypothetical protein
MKSVRLARAIAKGAVKVRNAKTGQLLLKFRSPGAADRLMHPYPHGQQTEASTFVNLSRMYSADQLMASNLEDLLLAQDLELDDRA